MAKINIRDRNKNRPDKKPNWEYRFEIAKIGGKRRSISKAGFSTKKEAMNAGVLALAEYESAGTVYAPTEMSVADYMDIWIKEYAEVKLADQTILNYKSCIKNRINPYIGEYKLKNITETVLQQMLVRVQHELNLSNVTMKTVVVVLKTSFKFAKNVLKFIKHNPAIELSIPTSIAPKEKTTRYITSEEFKQILEINKHSPERYYGLMISYFTGLRLSEVYGLTWDCVDFENKLLTVNKSLKTSLNEKRGDFEPVTWYLGECKTSSSYRTISMGDYLTAELMKYKAWQDSNREKYGDLYKEYSVEENKSVSSRSIYKIVPRRDGLNPVELVMVKECGGFSGNNSICHCVKNAKDKLGIVFTFHSLRHTHGTMLYENGAAIKDIQNRLGHSSFKTTMDTYVETTKKIQDNTVNIINQKFKL